MLRMRTGWLSLLLLLATGIMSIAVADTSTKGKRTITVSSQAEVKATPDLVLVSFAVETTAAKASEAATENARRSAAVADALKKVLGKSDTVRTTGYALDPRYESPRPGEAREPRITGYVARNEVQVESHLIAEVGALIDAAVAAGANRVTNLEFALSKRDEAVRDALEKAGASARGQAESAAKGLGVRIKEVLSASTQAGPIPMARRYGTMAMAAEARAPTPIEPGEVNVSVTLQVTYEIE